jgi:PHD/YefM family antitoxin component YafN of YafNO toxin-antitoxin module
MAIAAETMRGSVSITQFNKGQASKIFDRLTSERQLVVLKNNTPTAVVLSPGEYERMRDAEIDLYLLIEAQERIARDPEFKTAIPFADILAEDGLTIEDLADLPDVEIE